MPLKNRQRLNVLVLSYFKEFRQIVCKETHYLKFPFSKHAYDRADGLAMSSPLAPTLASKS